MRQTLAAGGDFSGPFEERPEMPLRWRRQTGPRVSRGEVKPAAVGSCLRRLRMSTLEGGLLSEARGCHGKWRHAQLLPRGVAAWPPW